MHVGEEIAHLLIVEGGAGHGAVSMKDDCGEALVSGRRAGGHGFDFGDGLEAWTVESVGGGGVVALGAGLLEDGGAASLFGGPLGGWLGGWEGLAAGGRKDWGSADEQSEEEA